MLTNVVVASRKALQIPVAIVDFVTEEFIKEKC
jgi:hypothetical protein